MNRHVLGSRGRNSSWYPRTTDAAIRPALMPGTPDVRALRPGGACRRSTRGRGGSPRWVEQLPPSRCREPSAPEPGGKPRESGAGLGCAGPRRAAGGSPRSPRDGPWPVARGRRSCLARAGCHAGRPSGNLPLAGGARLEAAPTPPEPSPPWLR